MATLCDPAAPPLDETWSEFLRRTYPNKAPRKPKETTWKTQRVRRHARRHYLSGPLPNAPDVPLTSVLRNLAPRLDSTQLARRPLDSLLRVDRFLGCSGAVLPSSTTDPSRLHQKQARPHRDLLAAICPPRAPSTANAPQISSSKPLGDTDGRLAAAGLWKDTEWGLFDLPFREHGPSCAELLSLQSIETDYEQGTPALGAAWLDWASTEWL